MKKRVRALGGREVSIADRRRLDAFVAEFKKESDRGAVLLASAYLENALETFLRKNFVDDKSVDKLFDGTGPLATFAARIDLAFALGLINGQTARDLHLIRGVRNDFAHYPDALTFDHPSVRDRCRSFLMAGVLQQDFGDHPELTARRHFLDAVALSYVSLDLVNTPKDRPVSPPGWQTPTPRVRS